MVEYLKLLEYLLKRYPEHSAEILRSFQAQADDSKTKEADIHNKKIIHKLDEMYSHEHDIEEDFEVSEAYDRTKYTTSHDDEQNEHYNVHDQFSEIEEATM